MLKNTFLLLACLGLFCSCVANSQPNPLPALQKAFDAWITQENEQNYCSKEQCEQENSGCSMRLSEELVVDNLVWGDLNGDGIKDAFLKADYEACSPGTWFVNVAIGGHFLVFLSDKEGNYQVLSTPKVLEENLRVGQIKEIKEGVLYGLGADFSGKESLHKVDIFWDVQFKYNGQEFEVLHQSPKRNQAEQK